MSSDKENESISGTPPELRDIANKCTSNLLPEKSKSNYKHTYNQFMQWRKTKNANSFSENVILAYFTKLSETMKPSTLWKIYSMLRTTINIEHKIDLSGYPRLHAFLKKQSNGYQAKKSRTLSAEQIKKFINEAPDSLYLGTKVALIVGIMGACRKNELYLMKIQDIEDLENAVLISVPDTKTKVCRKFTITGEFYNIFIKYANLRPTDTADNFFLNYQKGRCTKQVVGINKLGNMPKQVATFLRLANPELYTGHCFRRTSATMLIDAGANIETLKRHGEWKSTEVAEGYIDNSVENRLNVSNKILQHLDIEPTPGTPRQSPICTSSNSYVANNTSSNVCSLPNLTFHQCNNITINIASKNE